MMETNKNNKNEFIPTDRYDLRILQSLRQIIRAVDLHSRKLKKEHQITSPQLICLLELSNQRLTVAQLAQKVHLSPSTIVGIIDRLEEKQLVLRERDKQDRRKVHLSISDAGKQFIEDAPSPLQDTLASSLSNLSELEQSTISLALERVVELMEATDINASPILESGASIQND
jgi:DNA-binding MarR family transcriptional regulator